MGNYLDFLSPITQQSCSSNTSKSSVSTKFVCLPVCHSSLKVICESSLNCLRVRCHPTLDSNACSSHILTNFSHWVWNYSLFRNEWENLDSIFCYIKCYIKSVILRVFTSTYACWKPLIITLICNYKVSNIYIFMGTQKLPLVNWKNTLSLSI